MSASEARDVFLLHISWLVMIPIYPSSYISVQIQSLGPPLRKVYEKVDDLENGKEETTKHMTTDSTLTFKTYLIILNTRQKTRYT
jgi:hypothetical protein